MDYLKTVPEKSTIIPKLIENENMKLREALANNKELLSRKETEIKELESKVDAVSAKLAEKELSEIEFRSTCEDYEKVFSKMLIDHEEVVREKLILDNYVKSLDNAFDELLSKYERAKLIIHGLTENENVLKNQVKLYEKIVEQIGEHYNSLQEHATDKLNKANTRLDKTDKKHIAEMAKLKAKILENKAKINVLETQISLCNIKGGTDCDNSEFSIFAPLKQI